MNKIKYFFLLCLYYQTGFGQINFEKYRLPIIKSEEKIKIDGVLDEKTWKEVAVGKDFFMITPLDTGKATQFSEARVSYDDEFLYIGIIFFNNSILFCPIIPYIAHI